ncbi:MAG: sodium:solute symporter family protein [Fuerstiella sp.]
MLAAVLGLHIADWIVLCCYFVGILGVGIWSATKVTNATDFFMGGRRFGKFFMMFFAFGSGTSSDQAINAVAGTWRTGLAGIWWQFLYLPVTPFYWVIAPILRRIRALTTADFFGSRFSPATAILYSVYGIVISIVFIAGALFSSGKMINSLTGNSLDRMAESIAFEIPVVSLTSVAASEKDLNGEDPKPRLTFPVYWRQLAGYEYAILAMTVMFVIYGMAGGLSAAIITDFAQGILTIAFSLLLLPFVFWEIGGLGALHQQPHLKAETFDFLAVNSAAQQLGAEPITFFYVCVLSLTALVGIIVQPHIMGVCGAGKTEYEGRFGFTVGNFLKRFCTVAWTFTGLACAAWYLGTNSPLATSDNPADRAIYAAVQQRASDEFDQLPTEQQQEIDAIDRKFADELFGRAAFDILPRIVPGLVGLLMASLLAAVMSTSDAQMVVSSGLFTENIYKRHIAPAKSESHYLWVGRFAGLAIVVAALMLQATFTDVIQAMKVVIKTPAAIGISMWFGIFWRRWNTSAVWVATSASVATWIAVSQYGDQLHAAVPALSGMFKQTDTGWVMQGMWQDVSYLAAGVIAGVTTALLTRPQPLQQLDKFYTLLRTPVQEGEVLLTPCSVPEDNNVREPVIEFAGFQFPYPTRIGVVGFAVAWGLVFVIIGLTKLLSVIL